LAESVYEGMFLLDSGRYGRDPETVAGQIPKMIQEAGGEILVSRLWEERRLAYPIKGHRKGTYWLTYFRLEGRNLAEMHRKCQLSDDILRVLFVKVDPRIVATLVEHALAGPAALRSEEAGSKPSATAQKDGPEKRAETATEPTSAGSDAAPSPLPSSDGPT